jgi:hypothetical protein
VVVSAVSDVVYLFVTPTDVSYDTVYVCEGVPEKGEAAWGAYTETDQWGAWTENTGWAMSQGSPWGAYTQNSSYTLWYKPNVFTTLEATAAPTFTEASAASNGYTDEGIPTTNTTEEEDLDSNPM